MNQTQNLDGSWGGGTGDLNGIFPATAKSLSSLKITQPAGSVHQENATQYLITQAINVNPFLADRVISLNHTSEDVSTDVSTLLSLQNEDGGWGTAGGYESNVWDTTLVITAIQAAGVNEPLIYSRAINYLRRAQNIDNGWGLVRLDDSRVFYTAQVLQALTAMEGYYNLEFLKAEGVAYLRSQQQADGGYGEPTSTPFETALVLRTILESKQPLTQAEEDAQTYLTTQQLANGSWVDDPYSTALALRALLVEPDTDGDGMTDACETLYNLNINDPADALLDNDLDGLPNLLECRIGTNLDLADTDADTVSDPIELACFSDPLDVGDFNRPPTITSLPITTITEGDDYSYQINATDPENQSFTYALLERPAGLTLSSAGLVNWPSGTNSAGIFDIVIAVLDDRGCQTTQPYRLTVLAQGIDLTPVLVDTSEIDTDLNSLVATGSAAVEVLNIGGSAFNGSFDLLLFEDSDGNGAYDAGGDLVLGETNYSGAISSSGSTVIDVGISAVVQFRDNLVYALVDAAESVPELNESNNLRHSGEESRFIPPVGQFQPVVEWYWEAPSATSNVFAPPMVSPLTDTNGDGLVNERDIPAVIVPLLNVSNTSGDIIALQGNDGSEIFTINLGANRLPTEGSVSIGDIDSDGQPEIIATNWTKTLLSAFDNSGALEWSVTSILNNSPSPYLGNLDGDNEAEILFGKQVFDTDGLVLWETANGYWGGNDGGPILVDIDLDGTPETINGPSAHDADGSLLWSWRSFQTSGDQPWTMEGTLDGGLTIETFTSTLQLFSEAWPVIANVDSDPNPEIIVVNSGAQSNFSGALNDGFWVFDHDGRVSAGPFIIAEDVPNALTFRLGPPTAADFDGDGDADIAVAKYKRLERPLWTENDSDLISVVVYQTDGTLLWEKDLAPQAMSNNPAPLTAFDFDGDGAFEIVYQDAQKLYILDGRNGSILYRFGADHFNQIVRHPIIADVDNDGNAEIIISVQRSFPAGSAPRNGVIVIGDAQDNWGHARPIWNQWHYRITNVNANGSIPASPLNNFESYNNHRAQAPIIGIDKFAAPDLSVSNVRFTQNACPIETTVTARIGNGGGLHVPANLPISFYNGDPLSGGNFITTTETSGSIYPGEFEDVEIIWSAPTTGDVYVTVNETSTPNLIVSSNLAALPHTWSQTSGLASAGTVVNTQAYYGIDGSNGSAWRELSSAQNFNTGPSYFEARFPFPVNPDSLTLINSNPSHGFLSGELSFSNGFTTTVTFDANGQGTVNYPQQMGIEWMRLTSTQTKASGGGLNEFIVGGSYTETIQILNEGTGRLDNNIASAGLTISPCDTVSNQPPQIISSPAVTAAVNFDYNYPVQAIDPNLDTLTYALTVTPTGMTIDENSGLVSWTATVIGSHSVTVQVDDNNGGNEAQSFIVDVIVPTEVNYTPTVTTTPPLTATVNQTYTYNVGVNDLNNDLLSYFLEQSPDNAQLNVMTGELIWVPNSNQLGIQFFTIIIGDGSTQVQHAFEVNVESAQLPLPPLPVDADTDGFDADQDCLDSNPNVNPAATELPNNGLDDDCNPATPDVVLSTDISCVVVTNKRIYIGNDLVQTTLTLNNLSETLSLQALTGEIGLINSTGQTIISETVDINTLAPSGFYRSTSVFEPSLLTVASYTATLDINFGSQTLCQDNAIFDVTAIELASDLEISIDDGITVADAGEVLTYTINLTNTDSISVANVAVANVLPAEASFISASDGGAVLDGRVNWPTITLDAGEERTYTLTVQITDTVVSGSSLIFNTVVVGIDPNMGIDPTPDNNVATDVDDIGLLALNGDVSCDGTINTIDALFILQYNVNLRGNIDICPLPDQMSDLYLDVCDVNIDSTCNTIDALFILQCNVGLNNSYCPLSAP